MSRNRVLETSTTTGTGPLVLAGAVLGYRAFADVYPEDGTAEVYYVVEGVDANGAQTGEWEAGVGTIDTDGNLERTLVTESSAGGSAAVDFAAGTKRVFDAMSRDAIDAIVAGWLDLHVTADDPHGDRAFATSAVETHVAASDPHGDRAYADDLVLVDATALEAGNVGLPGWHVLSSGTAGVGGSAGLSVVVPFFVSKAIVVDRIETNISTAAVGGLLDVSVWRCTLVDGKVVPTERVFNYTGIDASATGAVYLNGLTLALARGIYAVAGTVNGVVTLNRVTVNAPGARCLRNGGSTQGQIVQGYYAATGYPAPSTWTATVNVSTANGAFGYRAQFALGWT